MDSHITVEALKRNPLNELSFVKERVTERPGISTSETFKHIVEQFAYASHIHSNNMSLRPQSPDSADEEPLPKPTEEKIPDVLPSAHIALSIFAKAKRKVAVPIPTTKDQEFESQMVLEQERFSLTDILNSGKMMRLKLDMDRLEDRAVSLEEFVYIMKGIAQETSPKMDHELVVASLVDAFHRIDVQRIGKVTFDMVSSFIIDQELAADLSKERAIMYHPSDAVDSSHHDNNIERLFYFPVIDVIGIAEQNVKTFKLYNSATLKYDSALICKTQVLAAEYIPDFRVFAVACADKTINFFDLGSGKAGKKFTTEDSQQCLLWSQTYEILFSAGMAGKIYGWKLEKLFDEENKSDKDDFHEHLAKGMPWPYDPLMHAEHHLEDESDINEVASVSDASKSRRSSLVTGESRRKEGRKAQVDKKDVCISHIIELGPIQQLAVASFDHTIKLWDIKFDNNISPRKVLIGHSKVVRKLSYSNAFNLLISCGFDFEVMVWNPYVSVPIARLAGHEAPLIGVECSTSHPTFITADSKGVIRLWDIRDFKVLQTFYVANILELRVMKTVPKHYRLVVGSRRLHAFDYERPFIPELSDDAPIFCTCYSSSQLQIFVAGNRSIKVWNASSGRPIRILANVGTAEITSICLDDTSRKIIVSDHSGHISMYDSMSGVPLRQFRSHTQEVTGLCYVNADHILISASWDRSIVVHNDTADIGATGKPREVFRVIKEAHAHDILCLAYFPAIDLIASGSRDNTVRLWSYETCKLEGVLLGHSSDILLVRFLDPYPLMLVSDLAGVLTIWRVKCSESETAAECLVKWNNMHTLERTSSVTVASHCLFDGRLLIILGDEKGDLRILNISAILTEAQLKPASAYVTRVKPRNPTRLVEVNIDIGAKQSDLRDQTNDVFVACQPLLDDHVVVQVSQWKAHFEAIKSVHFIEDTQQPAIFTAGLDQMAKLWTLQGDLKGVLKQGKQAKTRWDFELKEEPQTRRATIAQDTMKKVSGAISRLETHQIGTTRRSLSPMASNRQDISPRLNEAEMLRELSELSDLMPKPPGTASRESALGGRAKRTGSRR